MGGHCRTGKKVLYAKPRAPCPKNHKWKNLVELSGIEPLTSSLRIANGYFNSLSYVTFNFEMPRCALIILRMVSAGFCSEKISQGKLAYLQGN